MPTEANIERLRDYFAEAQDALNTICHTLRHRQQPQDVTFHRGEKACRDGVDLLSKLALSVLPSREAVIEECAKVAEAEGIRFHDGAPKQATEDGRLEMEFRGAGCLQAARRIRDLKSPAKEDERRAADTDVETRSDAERWRALISSQRFKMMGSSGFRRDNDGRVVAASEHLHFGLEVWNIHPEGDDPQGKAGRELLITYVEEIVRRLAAKDPSQ
ncbi:hypothetical protein [Nitrobacter sp.]|uniref:hypothetical protein n=1 Tax=Nitrobacter sp. TaxID=29420 RepID=UPI0029CAB4F2|nr:hypothetical protein [Nitrobacter sp.]